MSKKTIQILVALVLGLLILFYFFGCQSNQAKLEAENIEIVMKFWDACNTKDIEVFKEILDQDNYSYSSTFDNPNPRNYENTIKNIQWNFEFLADDTVDVVDIFASEDKVTSMIRIGGTIAIDMEGFPTTKGKELNTSFISVMQVQKGKIIEEWGIMDNAKFLEQIGIDCWPK